MSQKNAKHIRRLERRVEDLENRWQAAENAAREERQLFALNADRRARAARAETRKAHAAVNVWKTVAYAALIAAILIEIIAICVVKADAANTGTPTTAAVTTAPDLLDIQLVAADMDRLSQEPQTYINPDPLEQANFIGEATISHYCICQQCCGKKTSHPAYGITASGREATPYYSGAVDPELIPLGSTVIVDYGDGDTRTYRADDTGSAIQGRHIDVCVRSHSEAEKLGRITATVYWAPEGVA